MKRRTTAVNVNMILVIHFIEVYYFDFKSQFLSMCIANFPPNVHHLRMVSCDRNMSGEVSQICLDGDLNLTLM
jgi:hypothetical protein